MIRRANKDDAVALARVHVDSWQAAYRGIVPDDFLQGVTYRQKILTFQQRLQVSTAETYLIEEDGNAIGFVTFGDSRDEEVDPKCAGEIWVIYVSPTHWKKGAGRRLAEFAIGELKARGCDTITLWVLEQNARARRFYEAMGFTPDGQTKEVTFGIPLSCVRYKRSFEGA